MSNKTVDSFLPRDQDNAPIPVLSPSTIVNAALTSVSTATALPSGAQIVEVVATQNAWFKFGISSDTVTTTAGQFLSAGAAATYRVPNGATHLVHIEDSADGRIIITKLV